MITTKDILFFENLSQINYDNQYYDLHNDYECQKIELDKNCLTMKFKNIKNDFLLLFTFSNVEITSISLLNKETNLTIDNLYRGKREVNKQLIELSDDGKSYFYLEFYEGLKFEFWADKFWLSFPHDKL